MTGKNVTTAIMDDGVDYMHPDLINNFVSFVHDNKIFKGSWKREKWRVGKESNVTIWCRTVAIDVYLQFEHAVLE